MKYPLRCYWFATIGKAPFGYKLEPTVINGLPAKMLAANLEATEHVKLMYEMYSEPSTSIGDIVRFIAERGVALCKSGLRTTSISALLSNPVYVQADLDVYEFFKNQGTAIVNEAVDFAGVTVFYRKRIHSNRAAWQKSLASTSRTIKSCSESDGGFASP